MEHRCAACILQDVQEGTDIVPLLQDLEYVCERTDGVVLWRWYLVGGPGCAWADDQYKAYMVVAPFHDIDVGDHQHSCPPFNTQLAVGCLMHCQRGGGCENMAHELAVAAGRKWNMLGAFDAMLRGTDGMNFGSSSMTECYFNDMASAIHAAEERRTGPAKLFMKSEKGGQAEQVCDKDLAEGFPEEQKMVLFEHLKKNLEAVT